MQQSTSDSQISKSDLDVCREAIRKGSRSFYAASLLLPKRIRHPAYALYAFCRFADDAIDLDSASVSAIHHLRGRLRLIYAGTPFPTPVDRAFAETVARFNIPSALPDALFEGFEWDARGRRYENISELRSYAVRVAGSVGAMMALLMGVRSKDLIARACDLGMAMQLTNIARDVGEDARAGRIYLPLDWLAEAGIDPDAWLANPEHCDGISEVVARVLEHAEYLYERSVSGIDRLPLDCRPAIHAARMIYREIGQQVARQECDSVSQRAIVPAQRKGWLLMHATMAALSLSSASLPSVSALRETDFLIEALDHLGATHAHASPELDGVPWWNLAGRIARIIDLFDRLERMDHGKTVTAESGHGTAR